MTVTPSGGLKNIVSIISDPKTRIIPDPNIGIWVQTQGLFEY